MTCPRCGEAIVRLQQFAFVRCGDKVLNVHDLPGCLAPEDLIIEVATMLEGEATT